MSEIMELDQYSIEVASKIYAEYPEWKHFEKLEHESGVEKAYLYIELPAPAGSNLDKSIYLYTLDEEITVGMDYSHCHFNSWEKIIDEGDFENAISFIRALLSEELSVISWWNGEQWAGSSHQKSGEVPDTQGIFHEFNRIRVRSWRGTYDEDINA